MRGSKLLVVSMVALFGSTMIVLADGQTPDQVTVTADPANDPNKIVCKAGEPPIGSRLPGPRQCRTQKEWDDQRKQDQAATSNVQAHGYMGQAPATLGGH